MKTEYQKRAPRMTRDKLREAFEKAWKQHGALTRRDVETIFDVSLTTALQYLRHLHKGSKCTYIER